MNFSGIYKQQQFWQTGEIQRNISWVEVQELPGSNCYCDGDAMETLRQKLEEFDADGIHFIDSGNYHYMSRIWLEKLNTPFRLVVFDNHTDMQPPAFGGLLSCEDGWRRPLRNFHCLKKCSWSDRIRRLLTRQNRCLQEKVRFLSRERLREMTMEEKVLFFEELSVDLPVYLSVDKDVLCAEDASTTWSQGDMTLEELGQFVAILLEKQDILGMDVCGECDPDACEGDHLNDLANRELLEIWGKER